MSESEAYRDFLSQLDADLKCVQGNVFLVLPRVLRRVIKNDLEVPSFSRNIPHRKSWVATGKQVAPIVARDELGLNPEDGIPSEVILLPKPGERDFQDHGAQAVRQKWQRLLFHALVDAEMQKRRADGKLSTAEIRRRVDQIGQVAFDEILAVLYREHFISSPDLREKGFLEFVAVFAELSIFSPDWISTYFPSLVSHADTWRMISQDLDLEGILERTQVVTESGAGRSEDQSEHPDSDAEDPDSSQHARADNPRRLARLTSQAERALNRGNDVSAAILFRMAAKKTDEDHIAEQSMVRSREATRSLVRRLQATLEFDVEEADTWAEALDEVVSHSVDGFWNANKKLLYDLQKVCIDHERGVYRVDLLAWIRSFGRCPLKRALPNQREVLISKHLRSASRRLAMARLSSDQRQRIDSLLHSAAHSAEKQLRKRLNPLVEESLHGVGLLPGNVPEEVAWRKLIDELSDRVVERGYLTIGNFRDALSLSHIKLADLSGVHELLSGDRLLRADLRLSQSLDGVYHRGEFYLRWLQGVSSLAFGTPIGRFVTQFLVIPFGGAFVAIEGLKHLASLFMAEQTGAEHGQANILVAIMVLGFLACGLIHVSMVRSLVFTFLRNVWRALESLCVDLPRWLVNRETVQRILRSRSMIAARRFVLTPLVPTIALSWSLPHFIGNSEMSRPTTGVIMFLVFNLIFNSRWGRDCEEVIVEWVAFQWHRLRLAVFIALFEWLRDQFQWLLNSLERLMYAVDEWLRFKSGETSLSLVCKAVLGVVWNIVAYVIRFCVTLLIEPQINPIKHFPVVTVSHKIILPLQPMFANLLTGPLPPATAEVTAAAIVFTLPGVFGFLVWELNSNWRLYSANRPDHLKPALVGDHGETMIRLMKPGFHSGTLPKLFAKLRKTIRRGDEQKYASKRSQYESKLHHLEIALRHFVERELVRMLQQSPAWKDAHFIVGKVELASNSIRISLYERNLGQVPLIIGFQEQSGWLVAGILQSGWLDRIDGFRRSDLIAVFAGFYKISGVDLVREQIAACFYPRIPPYDVTAHGLLMWPDSNYESDVRYNLNRSSTVRPSPQALAKQFQLPTLESDRLVFNHAVISWAHWISIWKARSKNPEAHVPFSFPVRLLPRTEDSATDEHATQQMTGDVPVPAPRNER